MTKDTKKPKIKPILSIYFMPSKKNQISFDTTSMSGIIIDEIKSYQNAGHTVYSLGNTVNHSGTTYLKTMPMTPTKMPIMRASRDKAFDIKLSLIIAVQPLCSNSRMTLFPDSI